VPEDVKNKRECVILMKKCLSAPGETEDEELLKKVHCRHLSFGVDNLALHSTANASYMLSRNGPQLGPAAVPREDANVQFYFCG
ncbi:hypothetical protein M378DRAFT_166764, partial [Amanita muscaria Koide BX008]